MSDVPCGCCCSCCLLDGECHHPKSVERDIIDPFCTCDCFPCRFVAKSWINIIEHAGVVKNTSITKHLPPQELSEKDRWKVIDDYAYEYATMIGLTDRWLDVLSYMEIKMKDQIEENRNAVYSKEDFIDGVFDDFPRACYCDSDNRRAVIIEDDIIEDDGEQHKLV
jgi:hypothetical protein